jgi:hypothetical protein
MTPLRSTGLCLAAFLLACLGLPGSLCAQAPGLPLTPAPSNATSVARVSAPPELPPALPPLPPIKSPVDFFRELLAMNATERQKTLADRSPESQKLILAKVREYASLNPDQRELRLQVTELRWYLLPLMTTPATNRAAQLAAIPLKDRTLIEDRLREWDKLPAEVQKELLANQATVQYFTEIEGQTDAQRRKSMESLSPARRQKLQEGIESWNVMPEEQRRKILGRFTQFFDLNPGDKERALRTLSAPERRQIERTLRTFGGLSPDQRAQCLRGFEQFTSLSLAERQQFLKNAERWKLLTPNQRQAWRDLVTKLPPPMPPELPPLPPSHPAPRPAAAVATNGN